MEYRLNIKSDIYCEEDLLGFDKYVDTLSKMVTDKDFKTPFCIGIFGKWGSGKTSFMHLLEKRLSTGSTEPYPIPVWFNPWRYEKEEHLIIPFLKTIEHAIKRYTEKIEKESDGTKKTLLSVLRKTCTKIKEASAAFAYGLTFDAKLGGFGFTLDTSKAAAREEELANKRIEAKTLSEKLSSIYYEIVDELKSAIDEKSFRIVVFIDDLDRCLPEKAVEILEAIKLFLDIEGYLFVLGVDRDVVKKGISYRYRFFEHREEKEKEALIISPEDYLDKMIQLPLELPTIETGRKITFIENLVGDSAEFKDLAPIIDAGIGDNPRTLKRFINLLAFTVSLAETLKGNIMDDKVKPIESEAHKKLIRDNFIPILYIKWAIIVYRYPKVHNDIKGNKKLLIELQTAASGGKKPEVPTGEKAAKEGVQLDERLKMVLKEGKEFPDDDWLIERFIHLTESTVISTKERTETAGYRKSFKPGDRVLIPKGKFLYGDDKIEEVIDNDYEIDVFPVTNKQYKEFIDEKKDYPVPYGEENLGKPYTWNKEKRTYPEGLGDHPVVLVSYEDAIAFCEWRSKKEGAGFRLPTEEEWEKAARGEDGRNYPWGNEFDFKKLNCADFHVQKVLKDSGEWEKEFKENILEKNRGKALTTDVGRFADGASPYGCQDMAGNVWEWTSSLYEKDKSRVVRGGAWYYISYYCRCAYRFRVLSGLPVLQCRVSLRQDS